VLQTPFGWQATLAVADAVPGSAQVTVAVSLHWVGGALAIDVTVMTALLLAARGALNWQVTSTALWPVASLTTQVPPAIEAVMPPAVEASSTLSVITGPKLAQSGSGAPTPAPS